MENSHIPGYVTYLCAAGTKQSTIEVRLSYLRRLRRRHGSLLSLASHQLLEFLAEPSWAPETRRCARSSIRTYYSWAHRAGLIPTDPSAGLPRVRVPFAVPRPAPEEAFAAAIFAATPRVALMLALAWFAGLRRHEIAQIHTRDIHDGMLHVRGKGGRTRLVPLVPELRGALSLCPPGWIFPGRINGHLSAAWVGRLMARQLAEHWTAHTLRHAAATRWLERCGNVRVVQELLGHASLVTTQRYTRVPDSAIRATVLGQ